MKLVMMLLLAGLTFASTAVGDLLPSLLQGLASAATAATSARARSGSGSSSGGLAPLFSCATLPVHLHSSNRSGFWNDTALPGMVVVDKWHCEGALSSRPYDPPLGGEPCAAVLTQEQRMIQQCRVLKQKTDDGDDEVPTGCDVVRDYGAKCDGATDDTHRLQAAIDACARAARRVVLGHGVCVSQPLQLRSRTTLFLAASATLKAGKKWLDTPFLYAVNATNVSIVGNGTVDGSGAQWWTPGSKKSSGRPHLVRFDNVTNVRLQNITLLNAANHFTFLGGRGYRIFGVTIRSPPFHVAPNTDGLNSC